MAFVHLHNHTVFSMLDGATRIQDMVNRAVELGMPAVAITDHGYMYGVPDLALACDAVNHNTPEYKTWSHDKAFLEKDRRDELVEPDPEANPRERPALQPGRRQQAFQSQRKRGLHLEDFLHVGPGKLHAAGQRQAPASGPAFDGPEQAGGQR